MGKRSNFGFKKLAFYPTPYQAVIPLIPFLPTEMKFCEPCAGAGHLVRHLEQHGHQCVSAYDVEPKNETIITGDAVWLQKSDLNGAQMIITNPPWERIVLHQIIDRCSKLAPCWLLFDADWMHTKQAKPYLEYCTAIVSVGRVKWIEGSGVAGKDNCCWYLFYQQPWQQQENRTQFYGKQ
jgi:hypothetical protein